MRQSPEAGFTLVEMLVALVIFAILSAAGVGLINFSVQAQEQLSEADARVSSLQLARATLKSDLAQVRKRVVRNEDRPGGRLGFVGGREVTGYPLLGFVRAGVVRPDGAAPVSGLQYVEYELVDDRFIRRSTDHVDVPADAELVEQVLLENVSEVEISFHRRGRELPQWRSSTALNAELPQALTLTVTTADYGPVTMMFLLPGGVA